MDPLSTKPNLSPSCFQCNHVIACRLSLHLLRLLLPCLFLFDGDHVIAYQLKEMEGGLLDARVV
ncbi:hypothetical protein ACLOJK_035055, partial [Asimina triloba]